MRVFSIIILIFILSSNDSYGQEFSDTSKSTISLNLRHATNLDTNNFNIFPKKFNNKKVALVLSGGGARGIAQIGVLEILEENEIDIDMIVGTSIGSVIGGLYCSGNNATELKSTVKKIDWVNNLRLSDKVQRESLFLEQKERQDKSMISISLDGFIPTIPSSISSGYNILQFINLLFINSYIKPTHNFENLKIPFISVTTDLDKGERYDIKNGNISEAVKASITFPLLYSPTVFNGRNLVDGGLTSNIPVDVARENQADYIIAVNSTSPLWTRDELDNPFNTADQIVSITMAKLNELQLTNANIVIKPELGNFQATNFSHIDFLINEGKKKTIESINSIKSGIDSIEELSSSNYNNFVVSARIMFEAEFIPDSLKEVILASQNNNFVRYTLIENTLRKLYKTGLYSSVYAEISRDIQSAIITYKLVSNPVLRGIKVIKNFEFLDTAISDFKDTYMNKNINTKSLYKFYFKILSILRANNLPVADIKKFYYNYDSGELEIFITDGSIGNISISGNKRTNNSVIYREMKIKKKNIAYFKDFDETLSNIYSTNLFKQVSIDFDYGKNSLNPDVLINVVEKSSQNLRFALRADDVRKLQIFVDLRDENLFGTGNEAGINAIGGLRNRNIKIELKSNRFFNSLYTYNFNIFYNFRSIYSYFQTIDYANSKFERVYLGEFKAENYGLSFLLGKQLERLGIVYSQIIFEKLRTVDNIPNKRNQSEFNVLKLKVGGKIDNQNKIPFPVSGNILDFYYQTAQDKLGGNLSYSVLSLRFEQFFPLNSVSILNPKFIFGFGDKTTPILELFSLGGENSFYGMVEDEIRGRQLLLTSIEYRYQLPVKLFFDTYFSIRYDLGQVWENAEDVRFKDLRHGMGVSLQFDTPIGKASFSGGRSFLISKGFTKDSFIWGPYTFYFSIGYDL